MRYGFINVKFFDANNVLVKMFVRCIFLCSVV